LSFSTEQAEADRAILTDRWRLWPKPEQVLETSNPPTSRRSPAPFMSGRVTGSPGVNRPECARSGKYQSNSQVVTEGFAIEEHADGEFRARGRRQPGTHAETIASSSAPLRAEEGRPGKSAGSGCCVEQSPNLEKSLPTPHSDACSTRWLLCRE
jgi:hypothetical protein